MAVRDSAADLPACNDDARTIDNRPAFQCWATHSVISCSPVGTTETSPALQCWVSHAVISCSPVGTTERVTSDEAGFNRPYGTDERILACSPSTEVLGYFRSSLR